MTKAFIKPNHVSRVPYSNGRFQERLYFDNSDHAQDYYKDLMRDSKDKNFISAYIIERREDTMIVVWRKIE